MNERDASAVSNPKRVFAVIPAAGLSRRMGRPKLLLDVGGRPVLSRLLDALNQAGVSGIVVVTRRSENQIAEIAKQHTALLVQPDIDPPDMRASVQYGLQALVEQCDPQPDDGWLLVPADHPVLEPDVLTTLLENWHQHNADILLPTHRGQRGHPTLFRWSLADEVAAIPPDQGINWLVKSKPERVLEVPVASDTVLIDLDTPADYARLLERFGDTSKPVGSL